MKKYFAFVSYLALALLLSTAVQAQQFLPDTEYKKAIPADSMSAEQYRRAGKLAGMLMAPCCYSKTASEDQSGAAYSVKMEVRRGIMEGFDDDAILAGFSRVYGERILAQPKATGFNHMAWIMPIVALFIGGLIYVGFIRKTSAKPDEALTAEPKQAGATEDDPYLRRLERELDDYES